MKVIYLELMLVNVLNQIKLLVEQGNVFYLLFIKEIKFMFLILLELTDLLCIAMMNKYVSDVVMIIFHYH